MFKVLVLLFAITVCFASIDVIVDDTTTGQPDVTTSTGTQVTTSNTDVPVTTGTEVTTEATTQHAETTNAPTTPQPITTQQVVTTTAAPYDPSKPQVLNFTVPRNQPNKTCLRLDFALEMNIRYKASFQGKDFNSTLSVALPADFNDYDGVCEANLNSFKLQFWNNWTLEMNYTLKNARYELSVVRLTYYVNSTWFPNATNEASGIQTATTTDLHAFDANKGNSYKCVSKSTVSLGSDVTFDITNYQAEPFFDKYDNKFDIAVECSADNEGTSKLVPIIVGSALAVLIVLVLIAYLIGRRRHRSGYQTV